jgi:hypothetical protein
MLRELRETAYQFGRPFVVDSSKVPECARSITWVLALVSVASLMAARN